MFAQTLDAAATPAIAAVFAEAVQQLESMMLTVGVVVPVAMVAVLF